MQYNMRQIANKKYIFNTNFMVVSKLYSFQVSMTDKRFGGLESVKSKAPN